MNQNDKEKTDNPEFTDLKKMLGEAQNRIAAIEEENRNLREEIAVLRSRKLGEEGTDEFTAASGVLWKRKPTGGYESFPYCPTCKSTLADYSGSLLCLTCNWQAPIKSFEAPKVHHDLSGET